MDRFDLRTRILVLGVTAAMLVAGLVFLARPGGDERPLEAAPAGATCADVLMVLAAGNAEGASSTPVTTGKTLSRFRDVYRARAKDLRTVEVRRIQLHSKSANLLRPTDASRPANQSITSAMVARWDVGMPQAVTETLSLLAQRQRACPDQDIVLGGYGQGAGVLHRTLVRLGATGKITRRIIGAALISDPDRRPRTRATMRGRVPASSRAIGIERARRQAFPDVPLLNTWVKVYSVCRSGDVVCDFRAQKASTGIGLHGSYLRNNRDQIDAVANALFHRTHAIPRPRPTTQEATGNQGVPLRTTLSAEVTAGYRDNLRWSAGSALPPGLVLSDKGVLTGTPTASGEWTVPVTVSNTVHPAYARPVPATLKIKIGTNTTVNSVSGDSTCSVRANGMMFCWGDNNLGQLGIGNRENQTSPTRMGSAQDWATVSNGATHTCGIRRNGGLWCWGWNEFGQLGDTTRTMRLRPVKIATSTRWSSVTANTFHTCAITRAGAAWCWGRNSFGQLGVGNHTTRARPGRVGDSTSWASISAGVFHTCGTRRDSSLWCWGANQFGQLGLGSSSSRSTPGRVAASGYSKTTASSMNTCGLLASGGIRCWGANTSAQLGNGTTTMSATPVPVGGPDTYLDVSIGELFACGVTSSLIVNCWGQGPAGQLGRENTSFSNVPQAITSGARFLRVSAGWGHACGVQRNGTTTCWGFNSAGQVGDGTHLTRRTPVRVLAASGSGVGYRTASTTTQDEPTRQTTTDDQMARVANTGPMSFRIGTFNVLGSWHSRPGRDMSWMGPGPMRARWAAEVTRVYAPDVMGLNEVEPDQVSVMAGELPQYDFYPGNALGDAGVRNTITWNGNRFTKTAQGYIGLTILDQYRYNPYVRLKDNATGRQFWVFNVHNTPKRGSDTWGHEERAYQLRHEVKKVKELRATGLPVYLIGDMNDRDYTHCYIVSNTDLYPPQGGGDSCALPPNSHIEWIFGSNTGWSGFKYDRGPLLQITTDHHIMFATAKLG